MLQTADVTKCGHTASRLTKNKKKTKQGKEREEGGREGGAVGLFPNNIGINDDNEGEGRRRKTAAATKQNTNGTENTRLEHISSRSDEKGDRCSGGSRDLGAAKNKEN